MAKDEQGFISIDVILMACILSAAAVIWAALLSAMDVQERQAQHYAAVFLAQEQLNKMEYDAKHNSSFARPAEEAELNGCRFYISSSTAPNAELPGLWDMTAEVRWQHDGRDYTEAQHRQFIKR